MQDVGGRGATTVPQRYAYLQQARRPPAGRRRQPPRPGSAASAAVAAEPPGRDHSPRRRRLVDVYVEGDVAEAAGELRALGMRVDGDQRPRAPAHGRGLPAARRRSPQAAALELDARRSSTPFARSAPAASTSQGDAAIRGPQARALGPNGAGVTVGIISDSIDQVGAAASPPRRPPATSRPTSQILGSDMPGGTDEGRAMAEIVYDEAPGISRIAVRDGRRRAGRKAARDRQPRRRGRQGHRRRHELRRPSRSSRTTSSRRRSIGRGRRAWPTSSPPETTARQSWEGTYDRAAATRGLRPGRGRRHDPDGRDARHGDTINVVLQWAEPWGGAVTDFALDVYRSAGRRGQLRAPSTRTTW